jgi:hypothetical protein
MIESGFYIDTKDFDRKFNALVKNVIPEYAAKGAFDAMNELLRDAIVHPPQAPKDIGDLWGSRIVEQAKGIAKEIIIEGGFNIKYARRHHEAEPGAFKYTTTKGASRPGPKFLESKMAQFKDKYAWIIAETIRRMSK